MPAPRPALPALPLGQGGPLVSRLCLGAMMFGDQTDEGEAREMVAAFAEAGGSFLDTADGYAGGASERILGRAIAASRDRWTVATKIGNPVEGVAGSGGLSAGWIARGLPMSLERLGLEAVDLLYLHREDEATPLEETIEALGEALEAGWIRAWGFSNVRAWTIAEMVRLADRLGVARPLAAQPYYHALYRLAEIDYLPACRHFGIGVVPYSPLARGVLTGKYADGLPEGSRAARGDRRLHETELRPETIHAASHLGAHAEATGRRLADLALQWVLANRIVASVLIGPRTMAQLHAYLAAPACRFGPEDEALVDHLVPPGGVLGAYADPRYPYRGRVVA
jgi:aryl-alcohol dehydrogenase-like predicted oxidoreductase